VSSMASSGYCDLGRHGATCRTSSARTRPDRFVRWRWAGVWTKIMTALASAHADAAVQMIDTSIVRVHQHGACITRNRRQTIATLPSFNSRRSGYGCALMSPRPSARPSSTVTTSPAANWSSNRRSCARSVFAPLAASRNTLPAGGGKRRDLRRHAPVRRSTPTHSRKSCRHYATG